MSQSPVSKEKVSQTIQVLHLYVCPSQHIRLLIVLNQADRNICFPNRELVCLLRNDRDDVAKFALYSELSNGFNDILALDGSY